MFVALATLAIDLPIEARTSNVGGYCTWCSIATLAKAHRVDRLRSIAHDLYVQHRGANHPGYTTEVEKELVARGVNCLLEPDGSNNPVTLETYAATHGVVVTLIAGNNHSGGAHSVVVTAYGDEEVEFWDSSKPVRSNGIPRTWTATRDWFDRWWSGNAIVIFPDE